MDLDDPLDFENEDPLITNPVVNKKRKKAIGLDDLLTDHYKQKSQILEREKKRAAKAKKNYNSDEDENGKEALLSNIETSPPLVFPKLGSCSLLRSFINNEVNTLVELSTETGEAFLEGLLVNGWLSKLVLASGEVEKSIATWTFKLILYSSKEELRASACEFWCAILSSKNEVDAVPVKIHWFPSYSDLEKALVAYGFLSELSSTAEPVNTDRGPPENLIAWVKFTAACCQVRYVTDTEIPTSAPWSKKSMFSSKEAEKLVEVVTCLFLDRRLQGLSVILYECMHSAISYFTDQEWNTSCEKIAKSLACRVPRDINCLRVVDCISRVNKRCKQLRSVVAYQILVMFFENKITNEEEILNLLITVNVKDKTCDLFRMYIYLALTENWLLSCPKLEEKPVMTEMWGVYLRNCSCLISSTDLRLYASKVRHTTLLQPSAFWRLSS
ncbi:actin protein 2/3 complex subunit-like protein [Citrus sinensis]|uniref:Actin protein 2/3 complex subunit-like protein n=1 Tax=Citrus sinensis TaxID=2711 RepID=A0ACB8ITR6_CITSI|nr:actin protein 2/3 complex subunit-like protein [Citrus sinensis]